MLPSRLRPGVCRTLAVLAALVLLVVLHLRLRHRRTRIGMTLRLNNASTRRVNSCGWPLAQVS